MVLHAMRWFGGGGHVACNGLVRRTAEVGWQLRGVEAVQWQCGVVVWRSCAAVAVQWCGVAMVGWCNW